MEHDISQGSDNVTSNEYVGGTFCDKNKQQIFARCGKSWNNNGSWSTFDP